MKNCGNDISQLDFKREIVQIYLISHDSLPKGGGKPATSKSGGRVLKSIRYNKLDHYIKPVAFKKRRTCAENDYASVGRTMCGNCDVGLCVARFESFHTQR